MPRLTQMRLTMWIASAALARAGDDVADMLAAEAKSDAAATSDAHCWCKKLDELVSSRLRSADFELRHLESQKNIVEAENQQLSLEVDQHKAELSRHLQSHDTASSLASKAAKTREDQKRFAKKGSEAVKKALDALPQGKKHSQVRGTLRKLESKFAKTLEEEENGQSHVPRLPNASAKLAELAGEAAESTQQRLGEGHMAVEQKASLIDVYTSRREADITLSKVAGSLCTTLEEQAAERLKMNQDGKIALSHAKLDVANAAYKSSASKLVLTSRVIHGELSKQARGSVPGGGLGSIRFDASDSRGECDVRWRAEDTERLAGQALEEARSFATDLDKIVAGSSAVEHGLGRVLASAAMDAHNIQGRSTVAGTVKAAFEESGKVAEKHEASMPGHFEELRAAGHNSAKADKNLVLELQKAKADASLAVVKAGEYCDGLTRK